MGNESVRRRRTRRILTSAVPVWTSAVRGPVDVAIALVGFMLLVAWRVFALLVVAWCVVGTVAGSALL